jgi:arsenate reductase
MNETLQPKRVLVICTGNSARSQMAEGLLRQEGGESLEIFSAGSAPADRIHPLAVRAMAEIGLDISSQKPKPLSDFLGQPFDYIIAVCSKAAEACPFFPGRAERLHWFYDDPAAAQGTDEEQMAVFRAVRDDMKLRITDWLASMSDNREPLL